MKIDHLNEPCTMVEQNWPYEYFQILDWFAGCALQNLSILIINICTCVFFWKLTYQKNIAIEQNCLSAMKIEFINHIFPSKGDYLIYRPPLTLFSYKLKLHV
jgi:hypothetical protein